MRFNREMNYLSSKAQKLTPYVAGLQPQNEGWIKLNTNENPYPPSPDLAKALQNFDMEKMRLYPDSGSSELCGVIAENGGVDAENVFVGNGSDEVLALAFQAFLTGKTLAQPDISYGFYPVWSEMYDARAKYVPLKEDFSIDTGDYKNERAVIIANPNAPTSLAIRDVEELAKNNEFVIIDEAYMDFSDLPSAVPLTKKYDNLLVVRTFSKSYSLAGMRVGFAIGHKKLIDGLNTVKNAFNSYPLDMISQKMAIAALQDKGHLMDTCIKIKLAREKAAVRLRESGYHVLPSQANFLFVECENAKEMYEYLLGKKILVRYWDKPRIGNYLRITVGTPEEMEALITCVKAK